MRIATFFTEAKNGGYGILSNGITRGLIKAGHEIVESNPDVVFCYGTPDVTVRARMKYPTLPLVYYTVFESSMYPEEWVKAIKESHVDVLLTATEFTKWTLQRDELEAGILHHGVDDRWVFKPRRDDGVFTFVHWNAFEWRKGWDIVLGAFMEEFKEDEPVKLILKARETDNAKYLYEKGTNSLGIPNVETVIGHLTDEQMVDLMERADCGVFPCFTPDNEILTDSGFKSYKDIKEGDGVWTFNSLTGQIEQDNIIKVIIQNYDDDIVIFKNKIMNLSVTKNHRMYYKGLDTKEWKVREAGFFVKDSTTVYRLPISFNYTGATDKYIDTTRWLRGVSNKMHKLPKKVLVKDLLYVMGWYISEGCIGNEKDWNRINISQRGARQVRLNKLITILKKWGLSPSVSDDNLSFGSGHIKNILAECGCGAKNKMIPKWVFQYDKHTLDSLYQSMMLGDGTQGGHHESYYTISEQLRDDFQLLCLLLGYSTSYTQRYHPKRKIENHWTGESYDFMIDIRKEKHTGYFRANQVKAEHYKGIVWCVQTKNQTVITRKEGEIVASGNCKGEGWFINSMECVAQGIPVIMPNRMGMAEQWGEGYIDLDISGYINAAPRYPGFMIMPSLEDCKKKMRWAYEHQEECRRMGKVGSKEVHRKFNWGKIIKDLEQYLTLAIKNNVL